MLRGRLLRRGSVSDDVILLSRVLGDLERGRRGREKRRKEGKEEAAYSIRPRDLNLDARPRPSTPNATATSAAAASAPIPWPRPSGSRMKLSCSVAGKMGQQERQQEHQEQQEQERQPRSSSATRSTFAPTATRISLRCPACGAQSAALMRRWLGRKTRRARLSHLMNATTRASSALQWAPPSSRTAQGTLTG